MRYRPKRENYDNGVYGEIHYQNNLEKYCTYLENKNKQLTLTEVGCSLPSKEEIAIEAERRNPYVKHLVDFNNGMHEGFIDGADFVLEAIKNKK